MFLEGENLHQLKRKKLYKALNRFLMTLKLNSAKPVFHIPREESQNSRALLTCFN